MLTVMFEGAKKDLFNLIKEKGKLTLAGAVLELKLSKTTLRQHLLVMENKNLIRRRFENSGQGRPKVVFELTQEGQLLYPTQDAVLLKELLEFLNKSGGIKTIESFFETYWAKRKKQFNKILASLESTKSDEIKMRMKALRILLESEGFMPQVERAGTELSVRECHCPFPGAIRATKLPCKLELEFIQWALKIPIKRTSYIPSGDAACAYSSKNK